MIVFGGGNEGIVDELHVFNTCKSDTVFTLNNTNVFVFYYYLYLQYISVYMSAVYIQPIYVYIDFYV